MIRMGAITSNRRGRIRLTVEVEVSGRETEIRICMINEIHGQDQVGRWFSYSVISKGNK